ncbi:beta-lactamase-like protein 2 homolog [Chelonus insularis]|uniref:beta-lactamase-like protein 2 homolog n=1 Tax=Chelonus insularis TaxID=460826 RepID=UPI001589E0AF|nr:beta-lactamase-like protein 2 homolog [Chelonus insularis]
MSLTPLPLISKLSKQVIRILGCNPGVMTLQGTNTYLVGTGERRILIDSGDEDTAPQYIQALQNVLKDENATVEHLIITHWHHDHIGGVKAVEQLIQSSSGEIPTIWKLPLPGNKDKNIFQNNWKKLIDDQVINVVGAEIIVKYTPGHTEDHACLMFNQESNDNILFSGDCILGETTAVFENLSDYMASLKKILLLKPKTIYPGHGPVVEDPVIRITHYINHRNQREMQILETLTDHPTGLSVTDIVKIIYKNTPENLWPAASINISHHLQKLLKEQKVKVIDNNIWYLS